MSSMLLPNLRLTDVLRVIRPAESLEHDEQREERGAPVLTRGDLAKELYAPFATARGADTSIARKARAMIRLCRRATFVVMGWQNISGAPVPSMSRDY
jgi:hypothetical protein